MNLTRKEFIKGIIASTVVASAVGATAKGGIDKGRYRFIYNGYEVKGGERVGHIDISRPMGYDDMVGHVAMEMFRLKFVYDSDDCSSGNYYSHDILVYIDNKPLEIYSIGCDDSVYESTPDDNELIRQIKMDVCDAMFMISERFRI